MIDEPPKYGGPYELMQVTTFFGILIEKHDFPILGSMLLFLIPEKCNSTHTNSSVVFNLSFLWFINSVLYYNFIWKWEFWIADDLLNACTEQLELNSKTEPIFYVNIFWLIWFYETQQINKENHIKNKIMKLAWIFRWNVCKYKVNIKNVNTKIGYSIVTNKQIIHFANSQDFVW